MTNKFIESEQSQFLVSLSLSQEIPSWREELVVESKMQPMAVCSELVKKVVYLLTTISIRNNTDVPE